MSKNVPEIRFEGFSDGWKLAKLGSLYRVYSGGTPSRKRKENYKNPTTPWIKTTDLNNNVINKNEESISEEAARKMRLLPKETVLIAMYGGYNQIGRTGMLSFPATINQALSALEPINDIYSYFLITELNKRVNEWKKIAASSRKDPNITKKDVENFFIYYSSINEQTKIGNFFKPLDERIAIASQELARLKETKQGFLQKMFPKEGKIEPEIRLDGFDGKWEQTVLSDYKDVRDGTHDSPEYFDEGYPLVTSKNLKDNGLDMTDVSLISKFDFDAINQRSQVDYGDILFGMIGTIGNPVIVNKTNFAIKNVALIKNGGKVNNEFLVQLLKSSVFTRYIKNEIAGNTQKFLGLNKIRAFKFMCPFEGEQTAIGNFFKKLDDTIALHQQELELLKEIKKGFLQKMFI